MDRNLDFSFFWMITPIAFVIITALYRGWRPPALNMQDPNIDLTLAYDALHDSICMQLETLFKERFGEFYVLPDGLTFSAVGEHIYSQVETLEGLQNMFIDLLFHGLNCAHFETALHFVINWGGAV